MDSRKRLVGIATASSLILQATCMCGQAFGSDLIDRENVEAAESHVLAYNPTSSDADKQKSGLSETTDFAPIQGLDIAPASLPGLLPRDSILGMAAAHLDSQVKEAPPAAALDTTAPSASPSVNDAAATESSAVAADVNADNAAPLVATIGQRDPGAEPVVAATDGSAAVDDQAVLRGGVTTSPDAAVGRVDDLTRQILLKEIELERFNLHYTQEVAKQGRWKGWRYGMLNEVNMGMGLAGAIISVGERGTHIHNPEHINNARQENANFIPMIGAIIGASAAVLEFGINEYHDFQARGKGFSPKAARAHVQGLKNDIDRMLAERETLRKIEATAPTLTGHAELDDVEGKVLKDLRDQDLQEFERFHIAARRLFAFQQMQYFFDFSKNVTNALGYQFAFLSLHRHHRVWNGRAGVLFITSGVLFMSGPIASRAFGKVVGEAHRHWLRPTTQTAEDATFEKLKKDHAVLDAMCKEGKCTPDQVVKPVERSIVYGAAEKSFEDELRRNQKSIAKSKLTATQNVG
ncbi:MAG TPA: hypothetical protein V6C72_20025, partial [Chroococcales cyanobacterium]